MEQEMDRAALTYSAGRLIGVAVRESDVLRSASDDEELGVEGGFWGAHLDGARALRATGSVRLRDPDCGRLIPGDRPGVARLRAGQARGHSNGPRRSHRPGGQALVHRSHGAAVRGDED